MKLMFALVLVMDWHSGWGGQATQVTVLGRYQRFSQCDAQANYVGRKLRAHDYPGGWTAFCIPVND